MKKSKIKFIIKKAVQKHYGDAGFTATAGKLLKEITDELNKLYDKKHK